MQTNQGQNRWVHLGYTSITRQGWRPDRKSIQIGHGQGKKTWSAYYERASHDNDKESKTA